MTKHVEHRWPHDDTGPNDRCTNCGVTCREMVRVAEKKSESHGWARTRESLNKFFPCLSEDEAAIKHIIE